ncbi:MAG TPA: DUF1501 domain-containing protein [Bryobacteraceae bacterium]|nr:DUF1501 domain-containing protein [Bryobacteraceae bacterium]
MKLESFKSRREFLRVGCRALSTAGAAAALHRAGLMTARAQSSSDYKALVCIFLFGGNDANNLLIPNQTASYATYSQIRQNLAIPQASLVSIYDAASGTTYGLHPSLAPLAPLYTTNRRLAIMMNVGTLLQPVPRGSNGLPQLNSVLLPRNLYSHSDQQIQWQDATPQGGGTTGWAGRLSDRVAAASGGVVPPAITLAGNILLLVGQNTQPSAVTTTNFGLIAPASDPGSTALQSLLGLDSGATLVQAAQSSLRNSVSVAAAINAALSSSGSVGVTFPNTSIGSQLSQVAKLIQVRASLGASRQIFFCSQGGYDTHSNQLAQHVTLYSQLVAALVAFDQAMSALNVQNSVTTFTESDFSRTFQPNGNAGTDHGWGSHALVMGGAVKGGALYGTYPTLALGGPDDSGNRGTWVPSTSEDQYMGALAKWFGLQPADTDYVFPNLKTFNYQSPAFI